MTSLLPRTFFPTKAALAAVLWVAHAGCAPDAVQTPEADIYQTRNRVDLYASLEPDAPAAEVLTFGTQATLLEEHRSFVRIRTNSESEGWVQRSLLLDHVVRRKLRHLTDQSRVLPDQGLARARDTLNVHVEPYRWAATFYQLAMDDRFHILDRMLVDRLPASAATARMLPEPTGVDYWYLVRIPEIGQVGWLLANMAYADIPLEVAMLAQGRSIVGYFPIGSEDDESLGETKTTWLWVQSSEAGQTHDFDLLKVFRWDSGRDRYVVISQSSKLAGYLPIKIVPVMESDRGMGVGFHILLEKDGQLHQRTHIYARNRVYRLDEVPVPRVPAISPPGGFGSRYVFSGSSNR